MESVEDVSERVWVRSMLPMTEVGGEVLVTRGEVGVSGDCGMGSWVCEIVGDVAEE